MSTQVQYRRGSSTQNDAFTGALAEITVDTTNKTLRVHDGATAGGSNIATVAYVDNALSSLSANSITDGTSNFTIIASGGNIRGNVGGSTITNIYSSGLAVTGLISASTTLSVTGNANVGNLGAATVVATTLTGTLSTASQTNITSVGTLGSLAVTGNITAGNLSGTSIVGTLTTAAQTNITSVGTLGSLSVTGNITAGNVSATLFTGTATQARYADLAEIYSSDADYAPGTVLVFGGIKEVTQSTQFSDPAVAGVVSTDPAYLMNSDAIGVPVALQGRVPCQVVGSIQKGDRLVTSALPGVATAMDPNSYQPGCIIGKALEGYNSQEPGTIEVVVGRI